MAIFQLSLLAGLVSFCLLSTTNSAGAAGGSDRELLPYEPIQYIKTVSPSVGGGSVWREFVELSAQEAGELAAEMKKQLKAHLSKTGTSVVFAKGERVLTQRRSSKLKWESTIELPYSNTLSLVSVIMPILLENYKHSVIGNPIGEVLKGKDLENPLVKGRESRSFLDLLNTLPKSSSTLDLGSDALLKELEANGELAVYFANTILGQSTNEAWVDALLAIGMEEMKFTQNGHLVMSLNSILQYALTVLHDFRILGVVPKSEIMTPDSDHYLFGWWQNCPKTKPETSSCLLPDIPEDSIFSLSQNVRIYVSPSLELSMIIVGPDASPSNKKGDFAAKKELNSVSDILHEDGMIWKQIHSVISGGDESDASTSSVSDEGVLQSDASERDRGEKKERQQRETSKQSQIEIPPQEDETLEESLEDPDQSELAKWIHWSWPTLVFLFWVTISHVWVYWMFHCGWFIVTRISKRAHIPRPKTAADAGQN